MQAVNVPCNSRALAVLVGVGLWMASSAAFAAIIYEDDFEPIPGRDYSAGSATMTTPNSVGFRWEGNNGDDVVRDDQFIVFNGKSIQSGPASGKQWENAPGSTGRHALRFNYPAGAYWAEQRFDLSGAYPEIWARFWLRVPINYVHGSEGAQNNKLFMFWMDDYSSKGDGSTVGMEFRPDGAGGAYFYGKVSSGRYTVLGYDQGEAQFITVPRDRGRWMQLVVRIVAESRADAKDGLMQIWRRWEDETSFSQVYDFRSQPIRIPSSGPKGFSAGYLMGWSNSAYASNTEFLLDDFTLSTTSLLDLSSIPAPPGNVSVE